MTKQAYRETQRVKPLGPEGLEACRHIMANGYRKINEVMVDSFTASAIIAVYDKLGEQNQAKLLSLTVGQASSICFKLIHKYGRAHGHT